jgi:hypothetical protein
LGRRRYHDDDEPAAAAAQNNFSSYDLVGVDLSRDGPEYTVAYQEDVVHVVQDDNTSYHNSTTPRQRSSRSNYTNHPNRYSNGLHTFATLPPDNVPRTTTTTTTTHTASAAAKEDRRPIWQRVHDFVRHQIHLPTLGYANLDRNYNVENHNYSNNHHHHAHPQELPELRCSFGTQTSHGTWLNYTDQTGLAMALLVWVLVAYGAGTIMVLAQRGHVPPLVAALQCTLCLMVWACHAKCMFTDPGTIPAAAVPLVTEGVPFHTMCSVCQSYKPNYTHHCRICNRCVSRMDHHCPWYVLLIFHDLAHVLHEWNGRHISCTYMYCIFFSL